MKESKKGKCQNCNKLSNDLKEELIPTKSHKYVKKNICSVCETVLINYIIKKHK